MPFEIIEQLSIIPFWLLIAILSYFLFAVVSLGDKYLLSGLPDPKVYSFYAGILGSLVFILIPFVSFSIPQIREALLSLASGAFSIIALYFLFTGLKKFDVSRTIPAIGGFVPILTFLFLFLFSGGKEFLSIKDTFAFLFLIFGSVVITYNKNIKFSLNSLIISILAAFFFALHFVLSKYVYLEQSFWSGFIMMRFGALITAFLFLFAKDVRREVFSKRVSFDKKTGTFFVLNQGGGAGAFILQHFSIFLAGPSYVSVIAALSGIQYAFLFILSFLLSVKFPWVIKEEIGKGIVFMKIFAIILIIIGLIILNV